MDAPEMKQAFLIEYDSIAALTAPPQEDTEISYYLSKAEHEVLVGSADVYETNELMRKRLSNLLVTDFDVDEVDLDNGDIEESFYFSIPENAIKVVRERFVATSTSPCYDGKMIKVHPITQDEIDANYLNNPFGTPDHNKVWRLDHYDTISSKRMHQIITGNGFSPKTYGFIYIKDAEGIDVSSASPKNSILHEDLHDEVISAAVRMATAAVRQQNYQVAMNEQLAATDR